jgi:hypothetical protein
VGTASLYSSKGYPSFRVPTALSAGDMLRETFDLHHGQYQLVKHFPEQFFIIFSVSRTKQWALDRRSVSYRGRVFHFGDWSEECYARKTSFEFRVKVRVEGIPVHCWGEDVAARALGRSCAIHYVQERSRRRERTRSFDLWAWCSDPCDIPKEVYLTVTKPDRELPPPSAPLPLVGAHHDLPTDLKEGHVYTIRNHIEVVEDLSFIRGRDVRGGPTCRRPHREYVWSYRVPDSIGEKRERDRRIAEAGISVVVIGTMMMMRTFSRIDVMAPIGTVVYLAGRVLRGAMVVQRIASAQAKDAGRPPHSDVMGWRQGQLGVGFQR